MSEAACKVVLDSGALDRWGLLARNYPRVAEAFKGKKVKRIVAKIGDLCQELDATLREEVFDDLEIGGG